MYIDKISTNYSLTFRSVGNITKLLLSSTTAIFDYRHDYHKLFCKYTLKRLYNKTGSVVSDKGYLINM